VDALVKIIKAPICPQATKAAMVAAYHLARSDERVAARVATAGLVPMLVETLVDADKSVAEKALALLDAVLASEEGRASARGHALTVAVLVKKMFRVSDLATELAVSAMCRRRRGRGDEVPGRGAAGRRVPEAAAAPAGWLQGRDQGEDQRAAQDAQQAQRRRGMRRRYGLQRAQ
jgi:hypothetical protein